MNRLSRALFLTTMLIPSFAAAQEPKLSDQDRQEIVREVVEHFRAHPEELVDALVAGRKDREAAKPEPKADAFAGADADPWSGRADAPISVLVFSDYSCAPCVAVEQLLDQVSSERDDVKVVHRDFPVGGPDATQASLDLIGAFNRGEDWMKLRERLIVNGVGPEARITAFQEAGIAPTAETSPAAKLTLLRNKELARRAGVNNLPSLIVMKGDKIVALSGDITKAGLEKAIGMLGGTVKAD
jgi:protein-disulfide isomerase